MTIRLALFSPGGTVPVAAVAARRHATITPARGHVRLLDIRARRRPPALPLRRHEVEETLKPLRRARMLPAGAFTDPEVHDWELEGVFGGWICAAHVSAVAEPGAFVAGSWGASPSS